MSEQQQNGERQEFTINDAISSGLRLGIASELGQTGFNNEDARRNHFEVFGWPKDDLDGWDDENWVAMYLRNAYAKVVNDKPALTTWRDDPEVTDAPDAEGETEFEEAIQKAAKNHDIWSHGSRVDRAAGLGQHGLLLLGFDDVTDDVQNWSTDARGEFTDLDDVTRLKPVLETQIEDIQWGGPGSERWGKPESYLIDLSEDIDEETENDPLTSITVHHSRVVDVPATRPLDDDTLTRPRMEPVLNNLLDIEKTMGAAAEAAYRAADYGLHINADPTQVDFSEGADELAEELQRYEQDLQRYIRTQGTEVNRLGGDIQDPSGIIEANLDAIAAETGIPKREMRGNQQGEQSGAEQDEKSYFGMISERRQQYATPQIVRGIIDAFDAAGVIPSPQEGTYTVTWPDLSELSESDMADIESKRAQVIAAIPGLAGDRALAYLKNGADAIPDVELDTPTPNVDELNDRVQAEFEKVTANQEVDLTPPEQAQSNAEKVLRWREEHPEEIDGMTEVGWRRARQLADGGELTPEVIKKMAQFNRHRKNADVADEFEGEPWKDAGHVAWLGWGGDAGVDWAIEQSVTLTDD